MTVSTVGVIPRLLQMADDMPGVRWAHRGGSLERVCKQSRPRSLAKLRLATDGVARLAVGQPRVRRAAMQLALHLLRYRCPNLRLPLPHTCPVLSLALSLHAPTQELRQTIVPSAKAFKLDRQVLVEGAYSALLSISDPVLSRPQFGARISHSMLSGMYSAPATPACTPCSSLHFPSPLLAMMQADGGGGRVPAAHAAVGVCGICHAGAR